MPPHLLLKKIKLFIKIKSSEKVINKFKLKFLIKIKPVTAFKNSAIINITRFSPLFILRYKKRNTGPILFF